MALSKKQGVAIGVAAAAVIAIVGVVAAVTLNRPAEAVADNATPTPAATSPNVSADDIEWIEGDVVP